MRYAIGWAAALACLAASTAGQAEEKILYRYDALGRLTKSYRQSGPATGMLDATQYDKTGNRIVYDANNVMRTLQAGQSTFSADGRFQLAMQTDGNLVIYSLDDTPVWATGTSGH